MLYCAYSNEKKHYQNHLCLNSDESYLKWEKTASRFDYVKNIFCFCTVYIHIYFYNENCALNRNKSKSVE